MIEASGAPLGMLPGSATRRNDSTSPRDREFCFIPTASPKFSKAKANSKRNSAPSALVAAFRDNPPPRPAPFSIFSGRRLDRFP